MAAVRGPEFRPDTWNGRYDDASFPALAAEWAGTARVAAGPLDGDTRAALQLQVICNDSDWPERLGYYRRAVERERERHPMFGPAAANVNPCAFWPVERAEPPVRVGGPGPPNVLLVQNERDPATPLPGARETRAAFGARARMVAVGAGGHGVFTRDNACGNEAGPDQRARRRPAGRGPEPRFPARDLGTVNRPKRGRAETLSWSA
ncbi:alpha/beta hydrolase [Amycolatopsis sp. cg9]|uniref:alpha/beta hydrolase n=1 Tax=Amycolatopsis sp. cg9 TaxID=3238801 RepID=UPI0035266452